MSRFRWRFSLRTMFVVITAFAVGLALVAVPLYRGRADRLTAEAISKEGGWVSRESTITGLPEWLEAHLPKDYYLRTVAVEWTELTGKPDFKLLGRLPHLKRLDLCTSQVKTEDWRHLANLKKLRKLRIQQALIDTAGIESLMSCTQLESVEFSMAELDGNEAGTLARLPKVKRLDLGILSHGEIEVSDSPTLDYLSLPVCNTVRLRNLPQLATLNNGLHCKRLFSATHVGQIKTLELTCNEVELVDVPELTCLQLSFPKRLTFGDLPKLIDLYVKSNTGTFHETNLAALESLPRLKSLSTTGGLEVRHLARFLKFPALETLDLGVSHITPSELMILSPFPRPLSVSTEFAERLGSVWLMSDSVTVVFGVAAAHDPQGCGASTGK